MRKITIRARVTIFRQESSMRIYLRTSDRDTLFQSFIAKAAFDFYYILEDEVNSVKLYLLRFIHGNTKSRAM